MAGLASIRLRPSDPVECAASECGECARLVKQGRRPDEISQEVKIFSISPSIASRVKSQDTIRLSKGQVKKANKKDVLGVSLLFNNHNEDPPCSQEAAHRDRAAARTCPSISLPRSSEIICCVASISRPSFVCRRATPP